MNQDKNKIEILEPKAHLNLYGYEDYFNSFKLLYEKRKLPNTILLSGPKGLGKATFIYHFIHYLLSQEEVKKYSVKDFEINPDSLTLKSFQNNTHPNFFLLENILLDENIKINQVRNLLKFLNKSTYHKNIKIVLLDNAEYLNHNSSNALLKSLEEPAVNTFFFIINNTSAKILDTVKSRCVEYKFYFNTSKKKLIFNKIIQDYKLNFENEVIDKFLFFDTPGNLLRYLLVLNDSNINISKNILSGIFYLMDKYKNTKDHELLNFISLFIESFYNELSLNDSCNLNNYFINKYKILYLINDMKKFNLDKNNLLISIDKILKNETK